MTKERPILFSGEMVRALLNGSKTQTRRIVKPQPEYLQPDGTIKKLADVSPEGRATAIIRLIKRCPYGAPGDRLWVRETFVLESNRDSDLPSNYPPPFRDGRPIEWHNSSAYGEYWLQPHYRATDPVPKLHYGLDEPGCKWRPSIFMPRALSRITLEITGVRVERVQDITEEDAIAEGVQVTPGHLSRPIGSMEPPTPYTHRQAYAALWDSINAERAPWSSNPWVWVVEFKRVEARHGNQ